MIIAVIAVLFCSCGREAEPEPSAPQTNESCELALIAERGKMNDGGYNELSLRGIEKIAKVRGLTYKAYTSAEATDESRLAAIDLAAKGGAKVIITPGYHFETSVYTAQSKYPDIKFIIIDGAPHPAGAYVAAEGDIAENTASIFFSEEQMGFLAGYAAVMNGSEHLGFIGGIPIEAVRAYGNGYLQGAETAAAEKGLADGAITVYYRYTGSFENSGENEKLTEEMYKNGADIIFACNSTVLKAAYAAAEKTGGEVIGAEFDYSKRSSAVVTSVVKDLEDTVYKVVNSVYNNSFVRYSGKSTRIGAALYAIKLLENPEYFKTFTADDYSSLYSALATGIYSPVRDFAVASTDYTATVQELTQSLALKKVTVVSE